jgi:phage terminase large subunit
MATAKPDDIVLPHGGWKARDYQYKLWKYLCHGGKRAIAIWHRRAGKDDIALNYAACSMHERIANVWYCLPEFAQARKAIWTAVNPHTGRRRIDEAFPEVLRENTNDNEMFIRMRNGSTFQCVGSDHYGTQLGSSPAGIVYSEWALANPSAWAYHRPILDENNGWALFITTPRGRNHAYEMFKHASHTGGWFSELLTAEATGAISREHLDDALAEYIALYGHDAGTAQFKQEYLCDWSAALLGGMYTHEMSMVRSEGRVTEAVTALPGVPVNRAWDLGMRDDTSIWFYQAVGSQLFLLQCLSTSGASLEWWRDAVKAEHATHGWTHGIDVVPHDAKVRELGTGRTRVETMRALGLNPMLAPDASLQDGINAVRRTLPLCAFHPRCEDVGIGALEQYRREWDDEKKAFRQQPLHDWTSDRCDAFRYLALAWKAAPPRRIEVPKAQGWVIPPPDERPHRGIQL